MIKELSEEERALYETLTRRASLPELKNAHGEESLPVHVQRGLHKGMFWLDLMDQYMQEATGEDFSAGRGVVIRSVFDERTFFNTVRLLSSTDYPTDAHVQEGVQERIVFLIGRTYYDYAARNNPHQAVVESFLVASEDLLQAIERYGLPDAQERESLGAIGRSPAVQLLRRYEDMLGNHDVSKHGMGAAPMGNVNYGEGDRYYTIVRKMENFFIEQGYPEANGNKSEILSLASTFREWQWKLAESERATAERNAAREAEGLPPTAESLTDILGRHTVLYLRAVGTLHARMQASDIPEDAARADALAEMLIKDKMNQLYCILPPDDPFFTERAFAPHRRGAEPATTLDAEIRVILGDSPERYAASGSWKNIYAQLVQHLAPVIEEYELSGKRRLPEFERCPVLEHAAALAPTEEEQAKWKQIQNLSYKLTSERMCMEKWEDDAVTPAMVKGLFDYCQHVVEEMGYAKSREGFLNVFKEIYLADEAAPALPVGYAAIRSRATLMRPSTIFDIRGVSPKEYLQPLSAQYGQEVDAILKELHDALREAAPGVYPQSQQGVWFEEFRALAGNALAERIARVAETVGVIAETWVQDYAVELRDALHAAATRCEGLPAPEGEKLAYMFTRAAEAVEISAQRLLHPDQPVENLTPLRAKLLQGELSKARHAMTDAHDSAGLREALGDILPPELVQKWNEAAPLLRAALAPSAAIGADLSL